MGLLQNCFALLLMLLQKINKVCFYTILFVSKVRKEGLGKKIKKKLGLES